jgi:hypothetical protein
MATLRTALFSRNQPGGVFTIADTVAHPGSIFFVHSGTGVNQAGNGDNPDSPVATLDYAIGLCTANKGDVIYVMPGHAETIAAADGFDADVAGIRIVGLGWGAQRPTFTFSATGSTAAVGAASVTIENLRFKAGISAVVVGLSVEAAGTDLTLRNCDFLQGAAHSTTGFDFVDSVILAAGAHRATIEGCRFLAEAAVAGAATAIKLSGAVHNVTIQNNQFMGDYSTACVNAITTLSQHLLFLSNYVHNTDAGEPYLEVITGTTGIISDTRGQASGATVAANAVADAMSHCENFVTNTAGTIAIVKGAGGSPALDAD